MSSVRKAAERDGDGGDGELDGAAGNEVEARAVALLVEVPPVIAASATKSRRCRPAIHPGLELSVSTSTTTPAKPGRGRASGAG
ncbi:MAG: hypothetical protein R3D03_07565 [Geminicoccaceae bacterium]